MISATCTLIFRAQGLLAKMKLTAEMSWTRKMEPFCSEVTVPLTIEVEKEADDRWIAEVPELPGVLTFGQTRQSAIDAAKALAFRVLADRLEHGEQVPQIGAVFAVTP